MRVTTSKPPRARATRLADACVILIAIITSDRKSRRIPIEHPPSPSRSSAHSPLFIIIVSYYLANLRLSARLNFNTDTRGCRERSSRSLMHAISLCYVSIRPYGDDNTHIHTHARAFTYAVEMRKHCAKDTTSRARCNRSTKVRRRRRRKKKKAEARQMMAQQTVAQQMIADENNSVVAERSFRMTIRRLFVHSFSQPDWMHVSSHD